MKKELYNKLITVGIFAAAMAFIESLIVVYLRLLYYPNGFIFPLNPIMDSWVYSIEIWREFFTIVMLACVAILAAKKFYVRFAYFLYAFAVWDIFYYIWLKIILDWPASFLTWDVLFLIPIPWIGPVLAPIICAVVMIVFTFIIIDFKDSGYKTKIIRREWTLLTVGAVIILYTWLIDFAKMIIGGGFLSDFFGLLKNESFQKVVGDFVPISYNWWVFGVGIGLIITAIVLYYGRVGGEVGSKKRSNK